MVTLQQLKQRGFLPSVSKDVVKQANVASDTAKKAQDTTQQKKTARSSGVSIEPDASGNIIIPGVGTISPVPNAPEEPVISTGGSGSSRRSSPGTPSAPPSTPSGNVNQPPTTIQLRPNTSYIVDWVDGNGVVHTVQTNTNGIVNGSVQNIVAVREVGGKVLYEATFQSGRIPSNLPSGSTIESKGGITTISKPVSSSGTRVVPLVEEPLSKSYRETFEQFGSLGVVARAVSFGFTQAFDFGENIVQFAKGGGFKTVVVGGTPMLVPIGARQVAVSTVEKERVVVQGTDDAFTTWWKLQVPAFENVVLPLALGGIFKVVAPIAEGATGIAKTVYTGTKVAGIGVVATGVGAGLGYTAATQPERVPGSLVNLGFQFGLIGVGYAGTSGRVRGVELTQYPEGTRTVQRYVNVFGKPVRYGAKVTLYEPVESSVDWMKADWLAVVDRGVPAEYTGFEPSYMREIFAPLYREPVIRSTTGLYPSNAPKGAFTEVIPRSESLAIRNVSIAEYTGFELPYFKDIFKPLYKESSDVRITGIKPGTVVPSQGERGVPTSRPHVKTGFEIDYDTYMGEAKESVVQSFTQGKKSKQVPGWSFFEPIPMNEAIVPYESKMPMVPDEMFLPIQDIYDILGYVKPVDKKLSWIRTPKGGTEVPIKQGEKGIPSSKEKVSTGFEPIFDLYTGNKETIIPRVGWNWLSTKVYPKPTVYVPPGKLGFPYVELPLMKELFPTLESGVPKYLEDMISIRPKTRTVKQIVTPERKIKPDDIFSPVSGGTQQVVMEQPSTVKTVQKPVVKTVTEKNYLESMLQQNVETGDVFTTRQKINLLWDEEYVQRGLSSEKINKPVLKTGRDVFSILSPVLVSENKQGTISIERAIQDFSFKQNTNQVTTPDLIPVQDVMPDVVLVPGFGQGSIQGKVSIQEQAKIQDIINLQEKITLFGFDFGMGSLSKSKTGLQSMQLGEQSYNVQVKGRVYSHGKRINKDNYHNVTKKPLRYEDALAVGADVTGKTEKASFRIVLADGKPQKLNRQVTPFSSVAYQYTRKPDGTFVEKPEYRINSPGEIHAITMKGIQANRRR